MNTSGQSRLRKWYGMMFWSRKTTPSTIRKMPQAATLCSSRRWRDGGAGELCAATRFRRAVGVEHGEDQEGEGAEAEDPVHVPQDHQRGKHGEEGDGLQVFVVVDSPHPGDERAAAPRVWGSRPAFAGPLRWQPIPRRARDSPGSRHLPLIWWAHSTHSGVLQVVQKSCDSAAGWYEHFMRSLLVFSRTVRSLPQL